MKNATLRQLVVFEAAAKHLHFTRAAQELGTTQPSVSMQIRQLEENLGVALFEQIGKRTYLTEAGRVLYQHCREINFQLAEAETMLDKLKGAEGGPLRLAIGPTAKYFVPRLIAAFSRSRPGITVHLNIASREKLLGQIEDNECDMAMLGSPLEGQNLEASPFLEDPMVVITAPSHALAQQRAIPPSRLTQEPFLMREPGSDTRRVVERFFADHGLGINASMVINSNEAIKQGVQAGLGLAIVPLQSVALELAVRRLVVLDVNTTPLQRSWYIVHRQEKRFSGVAEEFKNFVLQHAQRIVNELPGETGDATDDAQARVRQAK